jgi:hypothetical protein
VRFSVLAWSLLKRTFLFSCNKGNQRPGLGLVLEWSANNPVGHILT